MPVWLCSDESHLSGCRLSTSSCIFIWWENRKLALWSVLIRVPIPFMTAPPSWPKCLPKAPPPHTITLEIRFQCMNFKGSQIFIHSTYILLRPQKVWWKGIRLKWKGIRLKWYRSFVLLAHLVLGIKNSLPREIKVLVSCQNLQYPCSTGILKLKYEWKSGPESVKSETTRKKQMQKSSRGTLL